MESKNEPTDSSLDRESLRGDIFRALDAKLTEKEKDIIILFFGLGQGTPLGLHEIGSKFNITRERVRQIKEKAIRKMKRSPNTRKILRSYL